MTNRYKSIDYKFRPASFWADENALQAILRNVTTVSSDFYPELASHYERFTEDWYRSQVAELS